LLNETVKIAYDVQSFWKIGDEVECYGMFWKYGGPMRCIGYVECRGNDYYIIPEFPLFLILPLFMIATLLAVMVYKRKQILA
jgi:hypothetical protein